MSQHPRQLSEQLLLPDLRNPRPQLFQRYHRRLFRRYYGWARGGTDFAMTNLLALLRRSEPCPHRPAVESNKLTVITPEPIL